MAKAGAPKSGAKGYALEEALRGYFLVAGLYVVRAVPLRVDGDDVTDIDLWLYERPSGSARRRMIVDAKFKSKPKATERMLWTKGLSAFLGVDGAYVATTDRRPSLRQLGRRLGLLVLDGTDVSRIAGSEKTSTSLARLSGEEFDDAVRKVETDRYTRDWSLALDDAKASLIEGFGATSANRSLTAFSFFADQAVIAQPTSDAAVMAVRLSTLCASMVAVSLDFAASEAAFRPLEERRRLLANVIRYGQPDREAAIERVRLASALISQFAENGAAVSRQVVNRFEEEVNRIPAEIIADVASRLTQSEPPLFKVAGELEQAAFGRKTKGFDDLSAGSKALLGALLDFAGISRTKFASATVAQRAGGAAAERGDQDVTGSLFSVPEKP